MGCLITQIENKTIYDVRADTIKKNVNPKLSIASRNSFVSVNAKDSYHTVIINSKSKNRAASIETEGRNLKVSVRVGLVCRISLGEYRLFYVQEGPFIVEEGYFKVKKI